MHLSSLPTPQVLIDRTRAMNNVARVQALASSTGARLRPHAKTHKSPVVARWQLDAGAVGIACAKIGEAEVFAGSGTSDCPIRSTLRTRRGCWH
jgi:D-serine deaminase-like pyridoxal phosphate-dependent protein